MASSLRRDVGVLTTLAESDVRGLFRATPAASSEALFDLLPALVREYGAASATVAADWYDDTRARREIKGRFRAIPVEPSDRGAQSLVGWALETARDDSSFQSLIIGGLQRRIADHARYTVAGSSIADPRARGWYRTGSGECDFCALLIGRGAVYREATADFESHDRCRCQAEPAFAS